MNNVDKQYLDLLNDIITNGVVKETRSGKVRSVFCRNMRFNLKEGLPLLTTKKIFVKGIIYELLWFLKGDTNIKYLVDNGVNIWNDDAYRYFCEKFPDFEKIISKETFINQVKEGHKLYNDRNELIYTYGDMGKIYGHQWRNLGIDQIKEIVNKLKNTPDDRRMIIDSWNPNDLNEMGLPPCHYSFSFYTREIEIEGKKRRELSCAFTMRSNDFCCGNPYNVAQYAMLTYMLCEVCDMIPGELIYNGLDVHVYENHIENALEQIDREGSEILPKLKFSRKITNINNFKYEDFIIEDYYPDAPIKYQLNVG